MPVSPRALQSRIDLALAALNTATGAHHRLHPPNDQPWTRAALAEAVQSLYATLLAADTAAGNADRDSGTFQFYDCGLAALLEELQV